MGLTSGEVLDIVNIIYYIPALAVSVYVAIRHGFRRSNGWLYILALDVTRIVGSTLGILAVQKKNSTLAQIAAVLSSVGLSVLIHAIVGLLRRVNEGVHKGHQTPPRFIDLIVIPLIIAIALAAWAGTKMADGKPQDYSDGQTKFKIAAIIFFIVLVLVAGLILVAFMKRSHLPAGEFRVVLAMGLTVPFLFVRVVYILCLAFASPDSKTFNLVTPDVPVEGVMSTAPEFITVGILLAAGVLARPSSQIPKVGPAPDYEMLSGSQPTKYQTYPDPEPQRAAWQQPPTPAPTHNAQHYYSMQ